MILAVLHILEPFTKIAFFSLVQGVSPIQLINFQLGASSILYNLGFFFLFPAMGIAMLYPNKWVLVLLVVSESLVITSNLSVLPALIRAGDVGRMISLAIFTTINASVIVMLMIPIFKLALTDRRMQWWRTFPRYHFKAKIDVNGSISGNIHNISQSGVFATISGVELNQQVRMVFTFENVEYNLNGIVRSFIKRGKVKGFGIEFNNNSSDTIVAIKNLVLNLKQGGTPRSAEQEMVSLFLPFPGKNRGKNKDAPTSFYTDSNSKNKPSYKSF